MLLRRIRCALLIFLPVLDGCDPLLGVFACAGVGTPYIIVHARDARTGAPAARGATGRVLQDGVVTDTFWINTDLVMQATDFDRSGIFDVQIEKAGYYSWTAEGIRVKKARCGIEPRTLQARLEPTP